MIIKKEAINLEEYEKIYNSFKYFLNNVFWPNFGEHNPAPHLNKWADHFQDSRNTAILSARKHLKSTLVYAYLMWLIYARRQANIEILYLSFKEDLARYHIGNIKKYIRQNQRFDCKDMTDAETEIKFTWDGKHMITVHPAGILSFKRGYHPDIVICDDILADPSQELNLTMVDKINRIFFEDVMSLPKEGGEIKLVGTAQHQEDLFFKLKEKKGWIWSSNPAILNEMEKKVLWPELFSYERLCQIRDEEIGEKAFNKEYLCSPVWSEDAYFKREDIVNDKIIDKTLKNYSEIMGNQNVVAGFDIGKARHPSHFSVFWAYGGNYLQVYQIFMDGWDYIRQVNLINRMVEELKIRKVYYDDTRGEMEGFMEQGIIKNYLWTGIKFNVHEKFKMAACFQKVVQNQTIKLQNSERMVKSILSVNNNLESLESEIGHGDAFWSIAMAITGMIKPPYKPYISIR